MSYPIEKLLPILTKLSEKYTSKASTSIPCETAEMLMGAVIYTIEEGHEQKEFQLITNQLYNLQGLYDKGRKNIVYKAQTAKKTYELILNDFNTYNCMVYHDTLIKGMPEFFMHYDAQFNPQNHIITLDYPLLSNLPAIYGVDLILYYLESVYLEQTFLNQFYSDSIQGLLRKINSEYESLYLDNICEPVLLTTVGLTLVNKPLTDLSLTLEDCRKIDNSLNELDIVQLEKRISTIIVEIMKNTILMNNSLYFKKASRNLAIQMYNGIQNKNLQSVLHIFPQI